MVHGALRLRVRVLFIGPRSFLFFYERTPPGFCKAYNAHVVFWILDKVDANLMDFAHELSERAIADTWNGHLGHPSGSSEKQKRINVVKEKYKNSLLINKSKLVETHFRFSLLPSYHHNPLASPPFICSPPPLPCIQDQTQSSKVSESVFALLNDILIFTELTSLLTEQGQWLSGLAQGLCIRSKKIISWLTDRWLMDNHDDAEII